MNSLLANSQTDNLLFHEQYDCACRSRIALNTEEHEFGEQHQIYFLEQTQIPKSFVIIKFSFLLHQFLVLLPLIIIVSSVKFLCCFCFCR